MRCPNCGRENPGIRLFCSRCGELLPESDAVNAELEHAASRADEPESDDDIKIYRRPGMKREIADEPEAAKAAPKTTTAPANKDLDEIDGDTDFFSRRERVRRLYEEDWPELNARQNERKAARSRAADNAGAKRDLFYEDGLGAEDVPAPEKPREATREGGRTPARSNSGRQAREGLARREGRDDGSRSPYARPKSVEVRRPPTLTRKDIADNGRVSTLVPKREETLNPENLFSVRGQTPFDEDDYDRPRKAPTKRARRYEGAYEEPESRSFFVRHVRGIVGLILLIMTAVIVATWAFTSSGQLVLARLDLAWSPSAYAKLGYDAYNLEDYGAAGRYFGMALERDEDNYDYAIYAANSYIALKDTDDAIAALKKCIALKPDNAELYVALETLYGGYENMPEEARKIVDEGYNLTGDSRLKP